MFLNVYHFLKKINTLTNNPIHPKRGSGISEVVICYINSYIDIVLIVYDIKLLLWSHRLDQGLLSRTLVIINTTIHVVQRENPVDIFHKYG